MSVKNLNTFLNVQNRGVYVRMIDDHSTLDSIRLKYNIEALDLRGREHLLMFYANRTNMDYVDLRRPDMTWHKHYGTKFKMKMTRNTRVLKSPYYRGVQLWEKLSVKAHHCFSTMLTTIQMQRLQGNIQTSLF